jgi:penicillin amidase
MKLLMRILAVVVILLIILVAAGFVLFNNITRGPLPQHTGELTVAGLNATVTIYRDKWGVPHIYASNTYDLFFAQGYTQAQDRWWQMEFSRHTGNGSIQELTGKQKSVMGSDVFIRKVGWRRAAERDYVNLSPEVIEHLQAFSDGVNAYITSRSASQLAIEYSLLGLTGVNIEIEPWTSVDTLVWGKVMSWSLSGNEDFETFNSELRAALGDEMVGDYITAYPFAEKPTIIFPQDLPLTDASRDTTGAYPQDTAGIRGLKHEPQDLVLIPQGEHIGSNNWVVHGSRTDTGMPLLANDPHLGIQMPSIWYEIGLHCEPVSDDCRVNVVGFTFPATAGIIIGHNDSIAWGVTNVGPDTQDLYLIKVNPDNELQYEWNGEWRDMTVHEEVINFGDGEDPIALQVRETHLGPIINDNTLDDDGNLTGFNNEDPMALRWTALESGTIFESVLKLNVARNWTEFRDALRLWDTPSQNFVYADVEGNIGYQTPGLIPIRAPGHTGQLPVDGSTDEFEWKGYVPFDNLPRVLNPDRGFVVTANQALVPLEYYDQLAEQLGDEFGADSHYVFEYQWDWGYRGERIVEMIEAEDKHSIATFQKIQGDNQLTSAKELAPYLEVLDLGDETLNEARDWMLNWDYQLHMDSPQAALYMNFWGRLMDNLYADQLGDLHTPGGGSGEMWGVRLLMDDPENMWWDDIRTDETETRDAILIRSFREGYDAAVQALGADREKWSWGDLHTSTFVSNPLGLSGISLIENMVNRGPYRTSGGDAIVNATGWSSIVDGDFTVESLPSMRMIINVGDFGNSVVMHTTGQSGHPFSVHYGDMIDSWRNIE